MLKELSNLSGLTKIILLGLVRSHFLQFFWLLKKMKAAVKHIALKLSNINTKPDRLNDFLVLVEKLEIHWFRLKNHKPIPKKLKTEAVHRSKYHRKNKLEIDSFEHEFHSVSDKIDFSPVVRIFISKIVVPDWLQYFSAAHLSISLRKNKLTRVHWVTLCFLSIPTGVLIKQRLKM